MNTLNARLTARALLAAAVWGLVTFSPAASAELSDGEAKKILKKNDCFKCHAIDKTKKGPSY